MRLNRSTPVSLVLGLLLTYTWALAQDIRVTGSTSTVGAARITFLASDLVRLEWSESKQWADWPSAVVVGRDWPAVKVAAEKEDDSTVVLRTERLTVRYRPPERFSTENLTVESPLLDGPWHPGDPDPDNLGGTRHSLDGVRETALPPLGQGLLSRAGYFFLDDSKRPLIDPNTDWLSPRPDGESQDWYFSAYGHEYRRALLLASKLLGPVPIPPKWAFGGWYSRYWPYTDAEERAIVNKFRELGIPLDVLVIDVDWHLHGWEGYDWNPDLFPDPEGFLRWVHEKGCKVALNNHPGRLPAADSHFTEVCRRLGVDPAGRKDIALNLAERTHAAAFMEVLHKPLHDQGVDFWWIDGSSAQMPGLDNQMWTSKVYFDYTEQFTGKRGLLFARYGGYGCNRYPVGFSGDTFAEWGVLGYEVDFTSRAANVLYPYWSHDIGGFNGDRLPTDLYVRWLQFGAFSPVLRLHSNHGIREPWEYGHEGTAAAQTYFRLRYQLLPYIYSNARRVHETGEPLCRPLYLDWPEEEEAYRRDDEYLFGEAILVAPVVEPAPEGQPARREVWLPPGDWVDFKTQEAYPSGMLTYEADLQTLPMFLRRGSIVVLQEDVGNCVGEKPEDALTVLVTVGRPKANFMLYEDDGESKDYQKDQFAKTSLKLLTDSNANQKLTIAPREGSFDGAIAERTWSVIVAGRFAPERVLLDGKVLPRVAQGQKPAAGGGWSWDSPGQMVTISLPRRSVTEGYEVELRGGVGYQEHAMYWQAGRLARHVRGVAGQLRELAGDWDSVEAQALAVAAKADALAGKLQRGALTLAAARRDIDGLADAELTALADSAARHAKEERSRLGAVCAVLGVSLAGRLEVTAGGKAARLRPEVMRDSIAPQAVQRLLASLSTPDGTRWSDISKDLACDPCFPAGLVTAAVEVRGKWAGLPLTGTLSTTVDASSLQLFHLVGPFDNTERKGLETVYPPETDLRIGAELQGKGGPVTWLKTGWRWPVRSTGGPNFVNLEPLFKPKDFTVAYAVAYLWAPRDEDAIAYVGSDDECKLWVNGEHVHTYPDPRPPAPDQDRVPVKLRQGWNTLLLKVCQEEGQWGFYLRLAGADDRPLEGVWTALTPEGTPPQ
ncbi:MAG: TIM-barrel domain-containing protein [Armatimonadota bacterium]